MTMRIRLLLASCLLATAALGQTPATKDPNTARGFEPGKLYNFHGIDSVGTFNGNLNVRIPMGTFSVRPGFSYSLNCSYNSKVWGYEVVATGSGETRNAVPERDSNAGLGWSCGGLGRILPSHLGRPPTFVSPDGAQHELISSQLRPGITAVAGTGYTTDGSYIRYRVTPATGTPAQWELELPDGLRYTFNAAGNLTEIRDRFENWVQVSYGATQWTIEDGHGAGAGRTVQRSHTVTFENAPANRYTLTQANFQKRVKTVKLASFPQAGETAATARATYTFTYDDASQIQNGSCGAPWTVDNDTPEYVNVPLLTRIDLPDGSAFTASYVKQEQTPCSSGSMETLTLPTGGSLAWTHGTYDLSAETCTIDPDQESSSTVWGSASTGVRQRVLKDAAGAVLESTTYTPQMFPAGKGTITCGKHSYADKDLPPKIMKNTVTSLTGDTTEHFFSVFRAWGSQYATTAQKADEYGLPFTRVMWNGSGHSSTEVEGRFLSTRAYQGSSQLQRTTYVAYEGDSGGGEALTNPRVRASRTVFETDTGDADIVAGQDTGNKRCKDANGATSNCYVDQANSDFDGFGHYRSQTTKSNFPGTGSGCASDARTATTNFNPGLGSNSNWSAFAPWLLNTYTTSSITEKCVTRTLTTTAFEPGTGVIRSVTRGSGANALVSATCRDARGFPISERAFGGAVAPPSDLCSATHVRQDGESILDHTWDFTTAGEIKHQAKIDGTTFYSTDERLEINTGLPKQTTDPAGLVTTYAYDTPGRLKSVQPPGVAPTQYTYANASATVVTWNGGTESRLLVTPAQAEASTVSASEGTIKAQYQYDAVGRLWREKTLMPDDSWTLRETRYDPAGRKASSSEMEKLVIPSRAAGAHPESPAPTEVDFEPSKKTSFTNYDPFGRVGAITSADGRQTSVGYNGGRVTSRTQHVSGIHGDAYVTTQERSDAHGRLVSVTEGAGTTLERTTSYTYDIMGNLEGVSMPGTNATQTRKFTYDDRGLLTSEEHPELGLAGQGRTEYLDYDASGRFRRRLTGTANGEFDLTYEYDPAGRLTRIRKTATPGGIETPLKEFLYDEPNIVNACVGTRCGKLRASARYNLVPGIGTVAVTEGWGYAAATGLPVRRDLAIGSAGTFTGASFLHTQGFNDVGGLASTTYPCPSAGCAPALERTVSYKYDNGLLYEVGGWARLAYQSNGMLAEVTHGRTVNNAFEATARETWDADPDGMSRPREIKVRKEGGAQHWSSGAYTFDGTGNIVSIGSTDYAYDVFGRLVQWGHGTSGNSAFSVSQNGYDPFGNYLFTAQNGCGPLITGTPRHCYASGVHSRAIAGTTNRYVDAAYDAAGNVLFDGIRTFTYDGLNMTTSATVGAHTYRYLYDANDERVAAFEILPAGNRTTWTLRGFRHELLRVWTQEPGSSTLTWKEDEIWRGTSLLGLATPQGRRHYALDHLGSPRAVMDDNGDLLALQNFEPFGSGGMTGTGTLQFTGHERDRASLGGGVVDLPDYAHARSLDTGTGRFLSVDPGKDWDMHRPQSWNMYSYVRNSPVNATDPTGRALKFGGNGDFRLQREVVATANAGLHGTRLQIHPSGNARLVPTNVQGPPSPRQAALETSLSGAINSGPTVSIGLTENSQSVIFGSFNRQTIDMADVRALGSGTPFSAAGTIAHEVTEQTLQQAGGVTDFQAAHAAALQTSNAVDGMTEGPSQITQTGNTVTIRAPYCSPTAFRTVEIDLVDNNVTAVRRPPQ